MSVGPSVCCCVYVSLSASICVKLGGSFSFSVSARAAPSHAALACAVAGSVAAFFPPPPQPARTIRTAPNSAHQTTCLTFTPLLDGPGAEVYKPLSAGTDRNDTRLRQRGLRRREP